MVNFIGNVTQHYLKTHLARVTCAKVYTYGSANVQPETDTFSIDSIVLTSVIATRFRHGTRNHRRRSHSGVQT